MAISMDAVHMDHNARVQCFLRHFPNQPRAVAEAVSRLYERNPEYFTQDNLINEGAAFAASHQEPAGELPLMRLEKVTDADTQGLFQQLEATQEPLPGDASAVPQKNVAETVQLSSDDGSS